MDTLASIAPASSPPECAEVPARDRETYLRAASDVLGRIDGATWSPSDVQSVLDGLAELALETTGADRVSYFLLDDDGDALNLWAVRAAPNEALWEVSVGMPSIRLDDMPGLRGLLAGTETLVVEDARSSTLVPPLWAELFDLGSMFVAPLRLGDRTLGALTVDYRPSRPMPRGLAPLVKTLAGLSALAVSNAMLTDALAQEANRLETLLEATGALRSPHTLSEVTGDLADLIAKVLDAPDVAIYLLDGSGPGYRLLAQRGAPVPPSARVADLPPADGPGLVLPLRTAGYETFGFIVVGSADAGDESAATLRLATALAAHVSLAVERTQLDERVALAAEFARALLSIDGFGIGDDDGNDGLLTALRDAVPPAIGFEVTGIRLVAPSRQPRGSFDDDDVERRIWASWRSRRTRPPVVADEARVYAPIWAEGKLLGVLRAQAVHTWLEPHELGLVEALANAIAERLTMRELRDSADRQARELTVIEERSRVAADLHATVGRLLMTIGRSADLLRDRARPMSQAMANNAEMLSRLAWAGRVGLQETAASLEAFEYRPGGLPATLGHVIERLASILDVAADLDVRGDVRQLPLEVEGALVRTMHEALARVEARGRASVVAVRLEYLPGEVRLEVRDDGVTLGAREDGSFLPGAHAGLRVIQRRLGALGGSLHIERPPPRGLLLRAVVPA